MDDARDFFFSAGDQDGVVSVFEVGEVEDVFIGGFSRQVLEQEVVSVLDGDRHDAIGLAGDSDAKLHFSGACLFDSDLEMRCDEGVLRVSLGEGRDWIMIVLAGGG